MNVSDNEKERINSIIEGFLKNSSFNEMKKKDIFENLKLLDNFSESDFRASLDSLCNKLLDIDPLLLLSFYSSYFLFGYNGKIFNHLSNDRLQQSHIELLQAFVLRNELFEYGDPLDTYTSIEEVSNLLKAVSTLFSIKRLLEIDLSSVNEGDVIKILSELMREHTQSVRNWGYPQHVMRIVNEILNPIEGDIEIKYHVRISSLFEVFNTLIKTTEKRLNDHFSLLNTVFQAEDVTSLVDQYNNIFLHGHQDQESFLEFIHEHEICLDEAKNILLQHSILRLRKIYLFNIQDLINAYPGGVKEHDIQAIMDKLSLSFGDLKDIDIEHLFLGNPIWKKPFIKIGTNSYFIPIVMLPISFCFEIIEEIINCEKDIKDKYFETRAEFLQNEIETIFRKAFPNAKIYTNSVWNDPIDDREYENDLLILIDSYLFVVEAKSGKITEPAKRGGQGRLKKKIEELLMEPSIQSQRFVNYLKNTPGNKEFRNKRGGINRIDISCVKNIARLNITLELFAIQRIGWPKLKEAGLISEDIDMVPTIFISDLYILFDILDSKSEKLHYLIKRTEFEERANFIGDEIDLLAFYLETGFNIDDHMIKDTEFILIGMSYIFDEYFLSHELKKKVEKPKTRNTKWWIDIISKVEEKSFRQWSKIGYLLLNVAYDDQKKFEKNIRTIIKNVSLSKRNEKPINAFILEFGREGSRSSIIGCAYKEKTSEERNNIIKNAIASVSANIPKDRIIIIGCDIEYLKQHYPYSIIASIDYD